MVDFCCVSLVLHYLSDILCKNYDYMFVFAKVIPKTLLVPFFSGHGVYDEAMVKEATAKEELGVKVNGQVISMIRYADDKAVVARSEKNLQRLMDNVSRVT